MAVGDESSHEVDQEVDGAAMSGMNRGNSARGEQPSVLCIETLEGAIAGLLKENKNRHDLTWVQPCCAASPLWGCTQFSLLGGSNAFQKASTEQYKSSILMYNGTMPPVPG